MISHDKFQFLAVRQETAVEGLPQEAADGFPAPLAIIERPVVDIHADEFVGQIELNAVLANYWPNSPWITMTNTAGLGTPNVQFALTNANNWDFSVLVSTNLTDWQYLGKATPMYQFADPSATNAPRRYYRLQWP